MLDIKLIRENPELVKENIKKKKKSQAISISQPVTADSLCYHHPAHPIRKQTTRTSSPQIESKFPNSSSIVSEEDTFAEPPPLR